MPKSEPLRRYILLISYLSSNKRPSLEQLLEYLASHELDISERTLQRDIEALRTNFGLEVQYDSSANGYFLQEDKRFPLDDFMRVAGLKLRSDLLMESINDIKHNQDFISFDGSEMLRGIEFMEPLLEAIRSKYVAKFTYSKFTDSEPKNHQVEPYHLKEYQGRWYVLAMMRKGLTIFALDRITNLKITSDNFNKDVNIDPKSEFQHLIGISWGNEQPVVVRLLFTTEQANYVKTLPWHYSQEIINEDENGTEVSFYLTINFEFTHMIVALGNNVKVLKPKALADDVINIHKTAFNQY